MTASTWRAPANAHSPEPDAHERPCGHFVLCAWPDGYWAVDFRHGRTSVRVRECKPDLRVDSLDAAKATAQAVFRNLLADAISGFGEQP